MAYFRTLLLSAALMGAMAVPAFAADATPPAPVTPAPAASFNDVQKSQIEQVVRDIINKNPEIIMDAAKNYQAKQQADSDKKAAEAVVKLKDKLFDPKDPIDGNPQGAIQIVEFFDYNCGYCKKVHEPMQELIKSEKDVKFIYKQFPILADSSKTAAKAALAADMQGKYRQMHEGLMAHKGSLDDATIMDIADKAGLNKDKLKKDMEGPEVKARIDTSMDLASQIGAHGTPTFIFDDKVVPGAMSLEDMKKMVQTIRDKKKADAGAVAPKG